jgi:CRP/FNR family transcriptional regulator, cyclic AMP receptor protein
VEWRLLAGVPVEDVRQLLRIARRRRFSRGEVVFHRGDPADSFHLIASGRFSMRVMTPLGQVATLAVRGPGESFGEMALVSGEAHRSATVTALEDAETFAVHSVDFDQLRATHPEVTEVLLRFLAHEVELLGERLLEALYLPVEKRVLRRLHDLAALYPAANGEVVISLTQESLSDLAGATRATVNQVLRREEQRGLLELARGKTRVLDIDALAERAR